MVANWGILWGMAAAAEKARRRWFVPTPSRLLPVLLAVEGLLWLSERFKWFAFNQHKGWTVLIAVAAVGVFFLLMFLWFLAALVFRLRFQFSLLSLFVLTVAVALPFAWLATEMKAAREQKVAVEEITNLRGSVGYDYQQSPSDSTSKPPEPAWLRGLLGDDLFVNVKKVSLSNSGIDDAGLERLKGLTRLQELDLGNTKVSDAGLEHLKGLTQLQSLDLCNPKISDAGLEHLKGLTQLQGLYLLTAQVSDSGLEHLKGLTQLQWLNLGYTKVSDAGLEHLKGLTQLQWLDLIDTKVSDAGLEHLKGLTQLQMLLLDNTKVSDAGVKKFQQALPKCVILR